MFLIQVGKKCIDCQMGNVPANSSVSRTDRNFGICDVGPGYAVNSAIIIVFNECDFEMLFTD